MSYLNAMAISYGLALWVLIFTGVSNSEFSSSADICIGKQNALFAFKLDIVLNDQLPARLRVRIRGNLRLDQYRLYSSYFDD